MFSFWLLLLVVAAPFGWVIMARGAPFVPTRGKDLEVLLDELNLGERDVFIDYGSGSGHVVRAVSRRGIRAVGYEINPFLVLYSKVRASLSGSNAKFHRANMWKIAHPVDATHIYIFLLPKHLDAFVAKLRTEINQSIIFISYSFPVTSNVAHQLKKVGNAYIYEVSPLDKAKTKK